MRRTLVIFCALLTITAVLAPIRSLHVHLDSDHHLLIHDGHLHDHDGHESHSVGHVVDMHSVQSQAAIEGAGWTSWGLALPLLVVWLFAAPFLRTFFRPPIAIHLPEGRRHHWRPPLRGPPVFSI